MPFYTALYVTLQHELFADVSAEHTASSRNSDYIHRNDILARMSNALRVTLEGRMSPASEPQSLHRSTLEGLIPGLRGRSVVLPGERLLRRYIRSAGGLIT